MCLTYTKERSKLVPQGLTRTTVNAKWMLNVKRNVRVKYIEFQKKYGIETE